MSVMVNESQFYMWRAIFALAHADHVVTDEELRFMAEILEDIPFSDEQRSILQDDAKHAESIEAMFERIEDPADQAEFFKFAKKLAHIDGDYGEEEQDVILRLKKMHLSDVNVDDLVGKVDMSLQSDDEYQNNRDFKETVYSYRKNFLNKLMGKNSD
ncbi:MAG: TerB family tellurite resistance protein [Bdellovibrionales bacterium]